LKLAIPNVGYLKGALESLDSYFTSHFRMDICEILTQDASLDEVHEFLFFYFFPN